MQTMSYGIQLYDEALECPTPFGMLSARENERKRLDGRRERKTGAEDGSGRQDPMNL